MNRQLGALSGLAMLLIVINHSIHMGTQFLQQEGYPLVQGAGEYLLFGLQALGIFAVPIFMFISGSFVTYAARGDVSLSRKFLGTTITHILLPYVLWSLLFYIVIHLHYGTRYTILEILHNLTVGYPFHFIPLLIFFYLLSPLLVYLGRKYPWLVLAVVGFYQLLLIILRAPGSFAFPFADHLQFLFPPIIGNTFADWGLYFPLGVIFSLHAASLRPWLTRLKGVSVAATIAFFALGILDAWMLVHAPLARYLCPLTFLLIVPSIDRQSIPLVRQLEKIGRRSYGIYLTHLIVLDLVLLVLSSWMPWTFNHPGLLYPFLILFALQAPLFVMGRLARPPMLRTYRYVFG
jgi:peptidoglycan/LPS O-acetylase OafA/YrhL